MMLLPLLALLTIRPDDKPPAPPREFRAVWVATVDNIDWPSKRGIPPVEAQNELIGLLDKAASLHFNAVILQVRPMADALYQSKLEPWSEFLTGTQGLAPKPIWDPLKFAVEEAHKRGLELHAWFNPFRAWHPAAKSAPDKNHVSVREPGWVKTYGSFKWLDPGDSDAQAFSLKVIQDVVDRYDVDGVHIDDYFYPYPIKGQDFPDDPSYHAYKSTGGKMNRGDWRRSNVDTFVHTMYDLVKKRKRWVKVGISPFGIYRPGIPYGIQSGVDQYDGLYADARKWLNEGWCDYFTPQLYWKIAQTHQAYPTLLQWWQNQNVKGRQMWPGNYASQLSGSPAWPASELIQQIGLTRKAHGVSGNVFFSMKPFLSDAGGINEELLKGPYKEAALVPDCPWLGGKPVAAPELIDVRLGPTWEAKIKPGKGVQHLSIWARYGEKWSFESKGQVDNLRLGASNAGFPISEVAVAGVDRYGTVGDYTVWKN